MGYVWGDNHHPKADKMAKAALLALLLVLPLSLWSQAAEENDQASPTYDATGDWMLHVEGPRLIAGNCDVMEDGRYDEPVHIEQHLGSFRISTDGGQFEQGTVNGAVYTHAAVQRGTDMTGVDFTLRTRSTFTLTSQDASVGKTLLDLRFADGTECLLDLRFEGERLQQEGRTPRGDAAPPRSA